MILITPISLGSSLKINDISQENILISPIYIDIRYDMTWITYLLRAPNICDGHRRDIHKMMMNDRYDTYSFERNSDTRTYMHRREGNQRTSIVTQTVLCSLWDDSPDAFVVISIL